MGRRAVDSGPVYLDGAALVELDILIVEDDPEIATLVSELLSTRGHRVTTCAAGDRALELLHDHVFGLVIADVRVPGVDGLTLLRWIRDAGVDTAVIVMSAFGSISEAVDAVKNHAAHYLSKPFSFNELIGAVVEVEAGFIARSAPAQGADPAAAIIGSSTAVAALRNFARDIASSDGPVLITGETGTGKGLVAATIHALSPRCHGPFVAVNCAAFPETLLEAELFGHERGAFTGAAQRRRGRFRAAHGGTLFLDEIGEMSPGAQVKLLRVLETQMVEPLGSDVGSEVDVRIISATNAEVCDGSIEQLREDLFYRIKMFHVQLPPLRARRGDLPLLVAHFMSSECGEEDGPGFSARAWAALQDYDYPGNVRELRSVIGHALALCGGNTIQVRHLPPELRGDEPNVDDGLVDDELQTLAAAERRFAREFLLRTLDRTDGNRTRAAELLGISRKTLWKKLRDLGIK